MDRKVSLVILLASVTRLTMGMPCYADAAKETDTGKSSSVLEVSADPGSMLIAHDSPVRVHTSNVAVYIEQDAIVFLVNVNDEVAVLNMTSGKDSDVQIELGSQRIKVPVGTEILVAAAQTSFEKTALSKCVKTRSPKIIGTYSGLTVFSADYLYISALDNCPQFQKFVKSNVPGERKVADRILKAASAECKVTGEEP